MFVALLFRWSVTIALLQAKEECRTFERFHAQFNAAIALADGACPLFGAPDDPSVRDAAIPNMGTPVKTVRLKINVFANDDGRNLAATSTTVDNLMTEVNQHYRPWRIQFAYTTRFINDSRFRSLALSEDSQMKSLYATEPERQHNVYVVRIEAGYSGWSTFAFDSAALTAAGGTVVDDNAFVPGRTTLTHELGHALGLWHTHHGSDWELPVCDPCWEQVKRDDADWTGDRCSDTPATPVNWSCANPGGAEACSGATYGRTDYPNFMGYSSCRTHFTPQQAGRMHAWINERLTSWLVPSPAEIVVTFDTTTVTDGQATPIDFGKAFQGQKGPVKMFTVQNVGGQTLVLGSVSVPLGYTLVKVPPSSLGPGQQDSFAVALETATQGTKAGQISFVNNDSDESPFNFPITGLVLPPPPTLVFVDSGSNCPSPDGSQACPFTTFCEGYDAVAICGTVKIQAGSYAVCRSQLTKCALFESLGGSVTLHPLTPSGQSAAGEAAVKLSGLRRQSDGSFALRFNGVAGQRYQVFSSTDLVTWELRSDFTSEEENFEIIDTNAAGTPKRFFKFVVQ